MINRRNFIKRLGAAVLGCVMLRTFGFFETDAGPYYTLVNGWTVDEHTMKAIKDGGWESISEKDSFTPLELHRYLKAEWSGEVYADRFPPMLTYLS